MSVFIDEAHIVESWGRTFRPDFQRLPSLISDLRVKQLKTVLLSGRKRCELGGLSDRRRSLVKTRLSLSIIAKLAFGRVLAE